MDRNKYWEFVMARIEMGAADIAGFGPANDSGESFFELGLMYAAGRSVPADLVLAHKWLNVAVYKGCREAVQHRTELSGEMTAEEIAAAQREARLFLTLH
jgi:TPR repeat protein